ncbi:unnamed protein product [Prorocentrum cordatum]|uniref:RING-type domain-containing protein n=1 Tax=Prorocentrum cordatum TaxID=2364126 RepID=A0ABN9SBW0_9DINO|nr:unnamed protein product [Polarella glacialis]
MPNHKPTSLIRQAQEYDNMLLLSPCDCTVLHPAQLLGPQTFDVGFLELQARPAAGAFLSGWALCVACSDSARELGSMAEALRRAVESAGERCVICLDRPPDRVIVYCGHLLCAACAEDAGAEYRRRLAARFRQGYLSGRQAIHAKFDVGARDSNDGVAAGADDDSIDVEFSLAQMAYIIDQATAAVQAKYPQPNLAPPMADWERYRESRKYKVQADTNVNPKHVGESLRTLTLEDRIELRRQNRELQKRRISENLGSVDDLPDSEWPPASSPPAEEASEKPARPEKRATEQIVEDLLEAAGPSADTAGANGGPKLPRWKRRKVDKGDDQLEMIAVEGAAPAASQAAEARNGHGCAASRQNGSASKPPAAESSSSAARGSAVEVELGSEDKQAGPQVEDLDAVAVVELLDDDKARRTSGGLDRRRPRRKVASASAAGSDVLEEVTEVLD